MTDILSLSSKSDSNDSWIDWQRDTPLSSLPQDNEDCMLAEQREQPPLPQGSYIPLSRSQYQAVVNRFHQATKHASNFASWTNA